MIANIRGQIGEERLVIAGAITLLILIAIISVIILPQPIITTNSSESGAPNGGRILREWLEQSGYTVNRVTSEAANLDSYDVLMIINPPGIRSETEGLRIRDWITQGGTLILSSNSSQINPILAPIEISLEYLDSNERIISLAAPTLINPPVENIPARQPYSIQTTRPDVILHQAIDTTPITVSFSEGKGYVFVSGNPYPFSNAGITDPASAQWIANMLAGFAPEETEIGFYEGVNAGEDLPPNVLIWLIRSNAGRGILLLGVIVFAYIAVTGRRFGAPVPLKENRVHREPTEYIIAIANLMRRSGQRKATLDHYRTNLRRQLAERYALDPTLSDSQVIQELVKIDNQIDGDGLAAIFRDLRKEQLTEADLLRTVNAMEAWLIHWKEKSL